MKRIAFIHASIKSYVYFLRENKLLVINFSLKVESDFKLISSQQCNHFIPIKIGIAFIAFNEKNINLTVLYGLMMRFKK